MIVIQTREFQKIYGYHVNTGGLYGRMAHKAASVITNLTNGLPAGVATSNNGETRLAMREHLEFRDGLPFPATNPTIVEVEPIIVKPGDSPAHLPEGADDETVRHKIVFLNGHPCLSIPHGLSQRKLALILNASLTELCVNMQQYDGHFVSPIEPLPDHIVRNALDRWRVLVNFLE